MLIRKQRLRHWMGCVRVMYLACLVCMACLGGCGTVSPVEGTPQSSDNKQSVTLLLWHAWPSPEQHTLVHLIDQYNQSHATQVIPQAMPIATLTSELRVAARAGSGPHLVMLQSHTIGALAQEGVLLPLDTPGHELVTAAEWDMLLPVAVESARVKENDDTMVLYGVPLAFDTLALYYNSMRIAAPPDDMTTLLETAHGLTNVTTQPLVWGLAYTLSLDKTIGYLAAFGGRVFDEEGTLVLGGDGRAGTERWLEWLRQMRQDERILAVTVGDSMMVESTLRAQAALMTIDWSHALASYQTLWGEYLGIATLPLLTTAQGVGGSPQPYVQSDVLSLHARVVDETEQQAALDFMRYLLSTESQQALLEAGKQPTLLRLSLEGKSAELAAARVFRQQAQQGQAIPNTPLENNVVREELGRMQLAVLRSLVSPAEAVTAADAALRGHLENAASQ